MSWDKLKQDIVSDTGLPTQTKVRALSVLLDAEANRCAEPEVAETGDPCVCSVVWGLPVEGEDATGKTLLGVDVWGDGDLVSFWHEWTGPDGKTDGWESNDDNRTTRRIFFGRLIEAFGVSKACDA